MHPLTLEELYYINGRLGSQLNFKIRWEIFKYTLRGKKRALESVFDKRKLFQFSLAKDLT